MIKNWKIVDSFLFSEPYEKELLLLKFQLEDKGVDEWIILENAYSLQGEFKGLHAKNLIENDNRFLPYTHKITVIENHCKNKYLPRHAFLDQYSFEAEHNQRNFAHDYFIEKYNPEDWIMISDVDEMVDFSDKKRYQELISKMCKSVTGILKVPTKRFWYDFDNEYKPLIGNAICTKKFLIQSKKKLAEVRFENRGLLKKGWSNIIQFEYSSCFTKDFVLRKLYTSTHTGFTPDALQRSLICNHRPIREAGGKKIGKGDKFFFEIVELTPYNSPDIVRNNLKNYKTNIIDKNYKENRRNHYPELFTIKYDLRVIAEDMSLYIKKKFRFFRRRMK